MSQREFYNAIEGRRELREFEQEQAWKRTSKMIGLLSITYLSQFPQKSQQAARRNIETVLSDSDSKKTKKLAYSLEEIEQMEAAAIRTAERMNRQIQENGISGS